MASAPPTSFNKLYATLPAARFGKIKVFTSCSTNSLKRSEEHTSESSHSQISYAVFCLKKKKKKKKTEQKQKKKKKKKNKDKTHNNTKSKRREPKFILKLRKNDTTLDTTNIP